MKQLLVYRHAKTEKTSESQRDFDRILVERGRKDAEKIGKLLKKKSLIPDLIITSAAKRAVETANLTAEAMGYTGPMEVKEEHYSTEPRVYYDTISTVEDDVNTLLMVGHNPEIEEFLEDITGSSVEVKTANCFLLELPVTKWADVHGLGRVTISERILP